MEVKFSNEKPPIYERCVAAFGPMVDWDDGIIFTYGDTIHCKGDIPPDLVVHESVHIRQQTAMGADKWWDKYLVDAAFRLSQEVEAYKAQVKWIYANVKDRNESFRLRAKIYGFLSSSLYGNLVTSAEARALVG